MEDNTLCRTKQNNKGPNEFPCRTQASTQGRPQVMGVAHNTMQPTGGAQGSVCCTYQE